MQCCFSLNVSGHTSSVELSRSQIEQVYLPLLRRLASGCMSNGPRYIILLAGPPGSGKSTVASLLEAMAPYCSPGILLQNLPMDGFHYPNCVLRERTLTEGGGSIPLIERKGFPESFDRSSLQEKLSQVRAGESVWWPYYDRTLHEPINDALPVIKEGVVLIEGNFLLLDEPGWRDLRDFADLGVFLECSEEQVRGDIITRHMKGGRAEQEASTHYERVDAPNIRRVVEKRQGVDITLLMKRDRELELRM